MKTRRLLAFLLSVLLAIGLPVPGEAAQGDLDPGFGGTGMVTTPVGFMSGAWAVAVQADGKIVAAGFGDNASFDDFQQRLALVRYLTDGTVDAAFGTNGRVLVDVPDVNLEKAALAIQSDGKIVVVGAALGANGDSDFLVARYDTTGAPDAGFGIDGIVMTDFGDHDEATSVALQSDGKIVVAGVKGGPLTGTTDFALARYDGTTGVLDPTFGAGGKVVTDVGGADRANGVAIQADGKIVAAGTKRVVSDRVFAVVRYAANGAVDLTFGGAGQVTTPFFQDTEATAVAIQADQKIVVVGTTDILNVPDLPNTRLDFAMARYNVDGSLDGMFGTGGTVTTDFAFGYERAYAVAIQADGRILVAGSRADAADIEMLVDFALARYETNGTLDTTFGTGGKTTVDFGAVDAGGGVALQPDCKIVVAGYSWDFAGTSGGDFVFALSRHEGPACVTEPPVAQRCPRTHGYWKNNASWPVDSLTLGNVSYPKAQLLALLGLSGSTDASLTLSRQLIAAKLNVANGSDPTPVSSTVTHADTLLAGFSGVLPYKVKPSSAIGQSMVTDATLLDQYNKGLLTPACTP